MQMAQVDSTFVRSSYGRICAAYLCIVGSVKDSMAETLPLRKTCYVCLSFFSPPLPSHACGYFARWGPWTIKQTRNRNWMRWQDIIDQKTWNNEKGTLQCIISGLCFVCCCFNDGQWTRRVWKVSVFSLIFLFLRRLPVYKCQTWKKRRKKKRVSKHIQDSSA